MIKSCSGDKSLIDFGMITLRTFRKYQFRFIALWNVILFIGVVCGKDACSAVGCLYLNAKGFF